MGVGGTVDGNIEVENIEYISFHPNYLIFGDKALAFWDHGCDFGRVDLIDFVSKQKNSDDYLFPILFCEVDSFWRQPVNIGDG